MTEDWEQSHLPLNDPRAVAPPSVIACAECTDLVHRDQAVIKQFYTGTITDVRYFCCDPCHHAWYVKRLRSWGM